MDQPQQHRAQTQGMESQLAAAAARRTQQHHVQPHPNIAQDQGDADEEQSQQGIAGAGANPSLVHLSITRLDAEAQSIGLAHPSWTRRLETPVSIDERGAATLATVLDATLATTTTPGHRHAHRNRGTHAGGIPPRVTVPATALVGGKDIGRAGATWMPGLAAAQHHRHEEWHPRGLQITHHADTVKTAVE